MSVSNAENQDEGDRTRDSATDVYLAFLDALNGCDLDRAERVVEVDRWREVCVGFTPGVIEWPQSRASMEAVWKGIPDVRFDPEHLVSDGHQVVAIGTVHGRQSGRLFGAPATKRTYAARMFDYVRVENGEIVDRIQQADMFGQLRQLFGPLLVASLLIAGVLLIGLGVLVGVVLL